MFLQEPSKNKLAHDYCGNIRIWPLVKPVPRPGFASGECHSTHYGTPVKIKFKIWMSKKRGDVQFSYTWDSHGIKEQYLQDFRIVANQKIKIFFVCDCGRQCEYLFMGKSKHLACRWCHNLNSLLRQEWTYKQELQSRDPRQVRKLINSAYTPYQKLRALKVFQKFLAYYKRQIKRKQAHTLTSLVEELRAAQNPTGVSTSSAIRRELQRSKR